MMVDTLELSTADLAAMMDHTFLRPHGTPWEIEKLCAEARAFGFAIVAINPAEVEHCCELLCGTSVGVGAAVGFPLGQMTTEVKLYEARDAIERGATEIDMVINVRALQEGSVPVVREELMEVAEICREAGVVSKAILETCYLTDMQKRLVCELALEAGLDFVKTSTGFGPAGATVRDVRLMCKVVGSDMGVKAAGGIRTLVDALAMVEAGATRIGTSSAVTIVREMTACTSRQVSVSTTLSRA